MTRDFSAVPANLQLLAVINFDSHEQALENALRAARARMSGVMLIGLDGSDAELMLCARTIKRRHPRLAVGVNHLLTDVDRALLLNHRAGLDMTWTDEEITHSSRSYPDTACRTAERLRSMPGHNLFVGVACNPHRPDPDVGLAARRCLECGFIATTSRPAAGVAPDVEDVRSLRTSIGADGPLAVASGIMPANAALYAPELTHMIVGSGVSRSYLELDEDLMRELVERVAQQPRPASGRPNRMRNYWP